MFEVHRPVTDRVFRVYIDSIETKRFILKMCVDTIRSTTVKAIQILFESNKKPYENAISRNQNNKYFSVCLASPLSHGAYH